jgi:DNA replication protein DnaC
MHEMIQEYAKRLKLSWIRENFHTVNIEDPQQYLLTLFEKEVEQREERKINLLFKSATLPNVSGNPFDWTDIQLGQDLSQESVLEGQFIEAKKKMIFYGGV